MRQQRTLVLFRGQGDARRKQLRDIISGISFRKPIQKKQAVHEPARATMPSVILGRQPRVKPTGRSQANGRSDTGDKQNEAIGKKITEPDPHSVDAVGERCPDARLFRRCFRRG